jgi:hypothetical protein
VSTTPKPEGSGVFYGRASDVNVGITYVPNEDDLTVTVAIIMSA